MVRELPPDFPALTRPVLLLSICLCLCHHALASCFCCVCVCACCSKGYGFVSFLEPMDALTALKEMEGVYVGNRPIRLKRSTWDEKAVSEVRRREKEAAKRLGGGGGGGGTGIGAAGGGFGLVKL